MREVFCGGQNLPKAYHEALLMLNTYGTECPCPDWNTSQLECAMTFEVKEPLQEPMISKLFIGGPRELEQYRMEMLDGILDFEVDRGNWHYTYHKRMAAQIPWLLEELRRNPQTRRAVIQVRDWMEDIPSDDPACLQHIQFFIRDGKLDCKVLFRSNDACKATFMNAFALIMLQQRIAEAVGAEMGSYTHRANSFHCYEKDYDMLKGYLKRIWEDDDDSLCYEYDGDWKDLMAAERSGIMKAVEDLKNRT